MEGLGVKLLEPFKVGSKEVALWHLQFVDGTIIFCFGKENSFILNYILGFLEAMLGLKINESKVLRRISQVICSTRV